MAECQKRPKGEEVVREWKRPHHGELHNLYASPDIIIRVIKSRRFSMNQHL
jgi:hypothetical protein